MDDAPRPSRAHPPSELQADSSAAGHTGSNLSSGNDNSPVAASSAPTQSTTTTTAVPLGSQTPAAVSSQSDAAAAAAGSDSEPLAAPAGARETPHPSHELPFVAPSSYLRPNHPSHTMADKQASLSPLDREQMLGLVSASNYILRNRQLFITDKTLRTPAERHPRVSQGPN